MKTASVLALLALAGGFVLRGAVAQQCYVSDGVLSLYNTPPSIKCVRRSDIPNAYISAGGNIASPFVYGALVTPTSLAITLSFFTSALCTGANYTVSCTTYPDSYCALDLSNVPYLFNVGPPTQCIYRVDTSDKVPVTASTSLQTIGLGAPERAADCPISVSPMVDPGCTTFQHSGPVSCPCPTGCISVADFSNTFPYTLNGDAYLSGTTVILNPTATFQAGSLYFNDPVPYTATRRSFAAYSHVRIDTTICDEANTCADGIGALVLQTSSSTYLGQGGANLGFLNGNSPPTTNLLAIALKTLGYNWLAVYTTADYNAGSPLQYASITVASNSVNNYYVWTYYNHATTTLTVYLSTTGPTQPATPLITIDNLNINSASVLGTNAYYVGYSGGTGTNDETNIVVTSAFCSCVDGHACTVVAPDA